MTGSKLQYISQGITAKEQAYHIQQALDHGADWVQVRWKTATNEEYLKLAEWVRRQCRQYQAICIINDRIDIAKQVDADGVHLGLDDEKIEHARCILGHDKIVGGTANTIADVIQRINEKCDYIGLGPYRTTNTKEKLSPVLGLGGYRKIIQYLKNEQMDFPPIYAIGGIGVTDVPSLLAEGVYGVAVSKVITDRPTILSDLKKQL